MTAAPDEEAAKAFSCHCQTVANVRQRLVEQGLENQPYDLKYPVVCMDEETLERETEAWYTERNQAQKSVDWQFHSG